jgi:hypothetical protein
VSETVGASRASILVHDPERNALAVVARLGGEQEPILPISVDDECSVSAHVFRTLHSIIAEEGDMLCEAERGFRKGAMLTVPIVWTTQDGGEPLGVVNLSDRRSGRRSPQAIRSWSRRSRRRSARRSRTRDSFASRSIRSVSSRRCSSRTTCR